MSIYFVNARTDLEYYSQNVDFEGVVYEMIFAWNPRAERWFLSINDEEGTPIVSGVKIVADIPLFSSCSNPDKIPGYLIAYDTTGAGTDPGLTDLGDRVQLMYFDESEI